MALIIARGIRGLRSLLLEVLILFLLLLLIRGAGSGRAPCHWAAPPVPPEQARGSSRPLSTAGSRKVQGCPAWLGLSRVPEAGLRGRSEPRLQVPKSTGEGFWCQLEGSGGAGNRARGTGRSLRGRVLCGGGGLGDGDVAEPPAANVPGSAGRVRIEEGASLRIDLLRAEDQGWYECRVLFLDRPSADADFQNGTWIHLTVNGTDGGCGRWGRREPRLPPALPCAALGVPSPV